MGPDDSDLGSIIAGMAAEARELLSPLLERTKEEDLRAKFHGAKWKDRHRLHVLIEVADRSASSYQTGVLVAPWLLTELRLVLDVTRRWRSKKEWSVIEQALADKHEFAHTLSMLILAEHLQADHTVEIIRSSKGPSPDLRLRAIGGTQEWVYIECYHPEEFDFEPTNISTVRAFRIVKKAMQKAKRQLPSDSPGMLAIGMHNQSQTTLKRLKEAARARLQSTGRLNLSAVILVSRNVMMEERNDTMSFRSIVSFEFIKAPSYFGSVGVEVVTPKDDPRRIVQRLIDTSVSDLFSVKDEAIIRYAVGENRESPPRTVEEPPMPSILKVGIPPPNDSMTEQELQRRRAVFVWENKLIKPLFEGEGNVDLACHNCRFAIGTRVWRLSCSNIIVRCPSCSVYNEFPALIDPAFSKTRNIGVRPGMYGLSDTIHLKPGVCLFGM